MEEKELERLISEALKPYGSGPLRPGQLKKVRDQLLKQIDDDALVEVLERRLLQLREGPDKEKVVYLSTFLDDDIQRALDRGFAEGLRDATGLESIVQEVAIEIGQLLQGARQEFGSHPDTMVRDGVMSKVETASDTYTLDAVRQILRRRLGLTLLDEVRQKLQGATLAAVGRFRRESKPLQSYIEQLVSGATEVLRSARERAQSELELEACATVLSELDELQHQYADPAAVALHLN